MLNAWQQTQQKLFLFLSLSSAAAASWAGGSWSGEQGGGKPRRGYRGANALTDVALTP